MAAGGPVPGGAGQRGVGEGTTPGGLPLFPVPALPEIGPAEQYLVDLYERAYGRLPALAARRHRWALHDAERAAQAGDERRAEQAARDAAALRAVLDKHHRCRRCGRALHHPDSIALKVGPECAGREL